MGPGQLVKLAGACTQGRVTWEGLSTSQAIGPEPESPGTAGCHRGPSNLGASRSGQLVDSAGIRTRAQVALDSWSALRAIGAGREWFGTAGQPPRTSELGASQRESWSNPRAIGP